MIDKKIVYTNEEGMLCVVHPNPEYLASHTMQDLAESLNLSNYRIVNASDIPEDRYFRNAWKQESNKVDVDVDKAKDIHIDKLREERNERLKELDVSFQIAMEQQSTQEMSEIASYKQELRNMPETALQDLAGIEDLEQIKNYRPECL